MCTKQSIEITGIDSKQLIDMLIVDKLVLAIHLLQWFSSLYQKRIKVIRKRDIVS